MAESSTRTVERALDLLAVICDAHGLTLSESSRAVDLAPSTALRLLRTLETRGFVHKTILTKRIKFNRVWQCVDAGGTYAQLWQCLRNPKEQYLRKPASCYPQVAS